MVLFMVLIGIAPAAWAQGNAANGKALVDSKKCTVCHKSGSDTGKPLGTFAGSSEARIKGAITNPKGTLGPDVKMPAAKLTDDQLNDVVAYIKSLK